jgi:hypothetical protein
MSDEFVSINDVRERFYDEDIELLGTTVCLVEITISTEQYAKGKQDVWLRFSKPGTPAYPYWACLEDAKDKDDVRTAFGLTDDERIWRCGERDGLTYAEAWECMERIAGKITGVKERVVEIALYRGQDEEGEVTDRVGIQLHFGDPGDPIDEDEAAYEFPAWMDPTHTLSGADYFALDDVPIAFNIDPDAKMWVVNEME